jgi:hypothetical protein
MTGLTPSEERYLYVCFIRALTTVVSQRLSNTGASGTTKKSVSSRQRSTTGQVIQQTVSDISRKPGDRRRAAS